MKSWRDQVQSTRQWSEPPCSVWRWSSSSSIRFRMWLVSSSCRTFMSEKTHSFFGETVILMQKLFRKDERRPNNNWNLVTNSIVRSIICSWRGTELMSEKLSTIPFIFKNFKKKLVYKENTIINLNPKPPVGVHNPVVIVPHIVAVFCPLLVSNLTVWDSVADHGMAKGKLLAQLLVIDGQVCCINIWEIQFDNPLPLLLNPRVCIFPPGSICLPFLHDHIVKLVSHLTRGCLQIQINMIRGLQSRIQCHYKDILLIMSYKILNKPNVP